MCSTDFAEWLRLNKKPIRKWFVWLFFFPSRALIFGIHIAYALSALYYYNDNNLWWWLDSLNWQNYSWKMIICVCVNPWNKRIHSSPNLISLMMWLIHIHITTAKSGTHSNKALSLSLTANCFLTPHTRPYGEDSEGFCNITICEWEWYLFIAAVSRAKPFIFIIFGYFGTYRRVIHIFSAVHFPAIFHTHTHRYTIKCAVWIRHTHKILNEASVHTEQHTDSTQRAKLTKYLYFLFNIKSK